MAQIGERQQSPFSTHEWTDGAMDMHPKSVKDEVIDLGQELPAIPEQVMAFRALGRRNRLLAPKEDAGISLLHLSEINWIALMMLYSFLDFSTERQNGHNPRGTEQSVSERNKDDQGDTFIRVSLSTSPESRL
ncbi:hypothetical protein MANI_028612 [Metarhizium anisopliae]|nr:hypothetical protein MANI_028612 [Metarhizium anisopliae]